MIDNDGKAILASRWMQMTLLDVRRAGNCKVQGMKTSVHE